MFSWERKVPMVSERIFRESEVEEIIVHTIQTLAKRTQILKDNGIELFAQCHPRCLGVEILVTKDNKEEKLCIPDIACFGGRVI